MDKNRVCRFLNNEISDIFSDRKKTQSCFKKMLVKYGVPYRVTGAILHKEILTEDLDDTILFCLVDVFSEKRIHLYFSESETNAFNEFKFHEDTIGDKIELDVGEIAHNLWSGKIEIPYLMKLRDNYVIYRGSANPIEEDGKFSYGKLVKQFDNGEYTPELLSFKIPKNVKWKYLKDDYKLLIFNNDNLRIFITGGYMDYVKLANLYNAGKDMTFLALINIKAE